MNRQFSKLYQEIRFLRRDIEEIKEILIPEVMPTRAEVKAVEEGKRQFARGEVVEWKEVKKRVKR